jgi:hypothetical protein
MLATWKNDGYELDDGEAMHKAAPDTFYLPSLGERTSLNRGDLVKLVFRIHVESPDGKGNCAVERMWVFVRKRQKSYYLGVLDNDPRCTADMKAGMEVVFLPKHVIQIYDEAG